MCWEPHSASNILAATGAHAARCCCGWDEVVTACNSFQLISVKTGNMAFQRIHRDWSVTPSNDVRAAPEFLSTLSKAYRARCACSSPATVLSSVPHDRQQGKTTPFHLLGTISVKLPPSRKRLLKKGITLQNKMRTHQFVYMTLYNHTLERDLLRTCHRNTLHSKVEDFICWVSSKNRKKNTGAIVYFHP